MNRDDMIEYCKRSPNIWDVIIIGGGATGLGAAVDAASRGFRTLLLEQGDFAKGTSSRSTKLVHGGLRYLKQGNIGLVVEALRERGLLCRNGPHLVSHLPFLLPNYRWWEEPFYWIGLALYDLLAGKLRLEKSYHLSREQSLLRIPTLNPRGLRSASVYTDGQFDDARLAITLAQTAHDYGAVLINYCPVVSLLKEKGSVTGVVAKDLETDEEYQLHAKVVINACGVFSDGVRKMDDPEAPKLVAPSQGIHIVLPRSFMPTDMALIIPQTEDGRVLFCIPWHQHIVIGTTDTLMKEISLEPRAKEAEIDFLLRHAGRYLTKQPKREDILSIYAGLRPLIRSGKKSTSSLSRDHAIFVSETGLITITGGKWTTYRRMAEDVIDKAIVVGKLKSSSCQTRHLKLHGFREKRGELDTWTMYGSDADEMQKLCDLHPDWSHLLHPKLPYTPVEVVWAVRREMALHLEDVLARRTRSLFLDAKAALEIAPRVLKIMAKELGKPESWERAELKAFQELAARYLPAYHP